MSVSWGARAWQITIFNPAEPLTQCRSISWPNAHPLWVELKIDISEEYVMTLKSAE